jgi:carboxypeptidase C (cathepsin A)
VIAALLLSAALAASQAPAQPPAGTTTPAPAAAQARVETADEKPAVTRHELKIGGRLLKYTATAGMMPIRNAAGETEAHIFYIAYTLDGPGRAADRPLLFSFNGGPGSSSVWLHMGAIGPRRVKMQPEGWFPQPPFELVDNEASWLDLADLVFIDPVGTGYSRPAKPELGKKFWSRRGDVESVGEFMRLYLTRNDRWASPLFVVGESYGTTRAAGLAGYLAEQGIAFNGVILVSAVLNFQTIMFASGNDAPYPLYVPGYTAAAWYHKKLPPELLKLPLRTVLDQSERFASGDLAVALQKGDAMTPAERDKVVDAFARLTGLDRRVVDEADLRVDLPTFQRELLRDRRLTVGRLDGRFTGSPALAAAGAYDYDPSMSAIRAPYTAMFADYIRTELGYKTDAAYHILGGGITGWDMNAPIEFPGAAPMGFPNVSDDLRSAMVKNPFQKVFVAMGYYDFATPYYGALYTVDHLGVGPELRKNIRTGYYEAGHMMYIDQSSRDALRKDVAAFFQWAVGK